MGNRITQAEILRFSQAVYDWRAARGVTQEQLADTLGVSRKTYVLLESGRWFPSYPHRAYWLKHLHDLDPALLAPFLSVVGHTLDEYVIVQRPGASLGVGAPSLKPLDAKHAKAVYDAAVYAVAEAADMPAKTLRPLVASLFAKLAAGGLPLDQAATLAAAKAK